MRHRKAIRNVPTVSTASPAAPDPPCDAADGADRSLVAASDEGPVESAEVVVHDALGDPVEGPWSHRSPAIGHCVDEAEVMPGVDGSVA